MTDSEKGGIRQGPHQFLGRGSFFGFKSIVAVPSGSLSRGRTMKPLPGDILSSVVVVNWSGADPTGSRGRAYVGIW